MLYQVSHDSLVTFYEILNDFIFILSADKVTYAADLIALTATTTASTTSTTATTTISLPSGRKKRQVNSTATTTASPTSGANSTMTLQQMIDLRTAHLAQTYTGLGNNISVGCFPTPKGLQLVKKRDKCGL